MAMSTDPIVEALRRLQLNPMVPIEDKQLFIAVLGTYFTPPASAPSAAYTSDARFDPTGEEAMNAVLDEMVETGSRVFKLDELYKRVADAHFNGMLLPKVRRTEINTFVYRRGGRVRQVGTVAGSTSSVPCFEII